jgi:hypothetical protein
MSPKGLNYLHRNASCENVPKTDLNMNPGQNVLSPIRLEKIRKGIS